MTAVTTREDIVVSGMSFATSLGCSNRSLREALLSGSRGLSFEHRFSDQLAVPLGELPWAELGISLGDPFDTDRILQEAAKILLSELNQKTGILNRYAKSKLGLFVGTTTSGIRGFFRAAELQKRHGSSLEKLLEADMQQACLASELADAFSLLGPNWTLSSSCAASAQALGLAFDSVRSGMCEAAIVVGADVLNLLTIFGFEALQVLDHSFCEPFQPQRRGINLAEALVFLAIERRPEVEADGAVTRICSYHALSEAYHMTQPAPDGRWMAETMRGALLKASLDPEEISYINPHGTGTEANDKAESAAVSAIFGTGRQLHASKRLTGHTLGAAGALEALISCLMLEDQAHSSKNNFGLSNSFGFGGANVSFVFEGVS